MDQAKREALYEQVATMLWMRGIGSREAGRRAARDIVDTVVVALMPVTPTTADSDAPAGAGDSVEAFRG